VFGKDSIEIAKQLLKKALRSRPDSETTKAIRYRLKLLDLQPTNKTKCQNCGKTIKQYKRRFRTYKFCYECHSKKYRTKE
jgi:Zn finger protein HypA/HybF involved in hydrogenase expression